MLLTIASAITKYYYNIHLQPMSEALQKQVLIRLKKTLCEQQNCGSDNQDNVQVIVFNTKNAKKSGLMCSGCLTDSQLLGTIKPIQKYCLPVRKYLRILINFYQQYSKGKQAANWGPKIVSDQSQQVKRRIETFYNQGLKNTLEIIQYVQTITKKATQSLKKIHQDLDFNKVVDFLDEQNQQQQQRMIISNQLSHICEKIKIVQGKARYSTEQKTKKQADDIIIRYQKNIQIAIKTLKDLVQSHKELLKTLL